jgi:hypothetical protein
MRHTCYTECHFNPTNRLRLQYQRTNIHVFQINVNFFYSNNSISGWRSTLRSLESYLQLRFWCMLPCLLADRCHRFRQTCSIHLPGGRWATGHPTKFHIHNTSDRDKFNCHMCPQNPGDYILFACVNTFSIIAASFPLTYKKVFQLTCKQRSEVQRSLHNRGCASRAVRRTSTAGLIPKSVTTHTQHTTFCHSTKLT